MSNTNRDRALVRDRIILDMLGGGATYSDVAKKFSLTADSVRTVVYRARQRAGIRIRPEVKADES